MAAKRKKTSELAAGPLPFPLVMIVWEDAVSSGEGGWLPAAEAAEREPLLIRQVGFVIADTPSYLVLAAGIHLEDPEEGNVSAEITIPKVMIRKRIPLSVRKE